MEAGRAQHFLPRNASGIIRTSRLKVLAMLHVLIQQTDIDIQITTVTTI